MEEVYNLYCKFDPVKHMQHYYNYLEVIILEDGTVEYAVPSHQEKLISICMKKLNVTRDQLSDMCPQEYYFNFMTWLIKISGAIAVWNNMLSGYPNRKQLKTLIELRKYGLYKGGI